MNAGFGALAARLAGQAALLLGWRAPEFWAATPAELAAVLAAATPPVAGIDRATLATLMEHDRDG